MCDFMYGDDYLTEYLYRENCSHAHANSMAKMQPLQGPREGCFQWFLETP